MENQALGQHIALTEIKASYTNPRKRFNDVDLQELADSIKSHGVMQPILVRPWAHPKHSALNMSPSDYGIKYQIVAQEKIASGELVLEAKAPAKKNAYQIEQEALHIKQAEETTRRLAIFNKLAKHLHNQDYENMSLRLAVDMLSREVSADLAPILKHYDFEGEEDEFFIEFLSIAQPRSCLIKMLALLSLVAGTEVSGWQWKSEESNADDKDYQSLLNFIGDIGLDVSQFLTIELPLTPPLAAQAVELTAETAEAVTENQLPPKLQAIKDKELAKRAKKAQKQEHNESANADLTTQALTESAQTSEVIKEVEVAV